MIEQSDLNTTKTSLENSNLTSPSIHENFRKIVEHISQGSNRVQIFKSLFSKCSQNQENDLAVRAIDLLDYLTSNYPQLICPYIDDEEFLQNIFEVAQKYQLERALVLIHHWEPYVQKNLNYFLKRKCDLVVYVPGFNKILSENPRLKHLPSDNPKVLAAITAANALLLSTAGVKAPSEDICAKIGVENSKIMELLQDDSITDQDRKGLEDLQGRLKKKFAELKPTENGNEKEKQKKKEVNPKSTELLKNLNDAGTEESKANYVLSVELDEKIAPKILTIQELRQYKLEKCNNPDCPNKPVKEKNEKFKNKDFKCPYWHFDYDKRRDVMAPNIAGNPGNTGGTPLAYHAKMCDKKGCRFKEKCLFGHNFFESYYHPLYYKKFNCKENLNGECDGNRYCPYVHEKEEEEYWTEYIKRELGLDRNKPFKLPVEGENEKPPGESEADPEVKKEVPPKKIVDAKPAVQKKTKPVPTGKSIEPPPGKVLDPVANTNETGNPTAAVVKENTSDPVKQNSEPKLKGFKGKEAKKDSTPTTTLLRPSTQPFFDAVKEAEIKEEKRSEPIVIEPQGSKAGSALQRLMFKEENKSGDEQEKKGKKKKKSGEVGTVDENIISRAFFIENEEISIANKKNFQFIPNRDEIKKPKIITKTICAMLNTEGGWIFLGFDENGKVIGVSMKFEERDLFKQTLINSLQRFSPKPGNNDYSISFIELKSQNAWANEILPDLYVIKIQIKKADPKNFFCNEKEEYYHRGEDGKNERYSPKQVQEEIIRRRTPLLVAPSVQSKETKESKESGPSSGNPTVLLNNQPNAPSSQSQAYPQQQQQEKPQVQQQPQQQQPPMGQNPQPGPGGFWSPPYGMNFGPSQFFPYAGGPNPQMGSQLHPPGIFVVFVPYTPHQPNPFSQLLNMAMMAPYMASPMPTSFPENKAEESKSEGGYPQQNPGPNPYSSQGGSYMPQQQQQSQPSTLSYPNQGSGMKMSPQQQQSSSLANSKSTQPSQMPNGVQSSQPSFKSQMQNQPYGFMHPPHQYGPYQMNPYQYNGTPYGESDNSTGTQTQTQPPKQFGYPAPNPYYYGQSGMNMGNQAPFNMSQPQQGMNWQMPLQNPQYQGPNWPGYPSMSSGQMNTVQKPSQDKDETSATENKN